MKKAYVYKRGSYESVVVAENESEARNIVGIYDQNIEFKEERLGAYNTPTGPFGIVVATNTNEIRENESVNAEYWNYIDEIIEEHVNACIQELKDWSLTEMDFKDDEENFIFEISKKVGEALIDQLETLCKAEFPVCLTE